MFNFEADSLLHRNVDLLSAFIFSSPSRPTVPFKSAVCRHSQTLTRLLLGNTHEGPSFMMNEL